ncbi:hypothetical protein NDU88_000185 [Pleurodeles waltl]|uniref:Uncharacterized protein n=1 Tax=Pleurodeles waltl TaxID=8319 RepID=A0AAV7LHV1_PLEWA|nr:hypothetical protein NDU88_000185 [Pleurodeles waltl]
MLGRRLGSSRAPLAASLAGAVRRTPNPLLDNACRAGCPSVSAQGYHYLKRLLLRWGGHCCRRGFLMTEDGFPRRCFQEDRKKRNEKTGIGNTDIRVPGFGDCLLLPASHRYVFGNPAIRIPDIFDTVPTGITRAAFHSRFNVGCGRGVQLPATW